MTREKGYDLRDALIGKISEARRYADREGFELSTVCLSHEATDMILAALAPSPTGNEAPRGVVPDRVPLSECSVGLFLADSGALCLKTGYRSNEGRIDAYIVETGEFFWGGGSQSIEQQRNQGVRPVPLEQIADAITLPFRAAAPPPPVSTEPDSRAGAEREALSDSRKGFDLAYLSFASSVDGGTSQIALLAFEAAWNAALAALHPSPSTASGAAAPVGERVRHLKRGTEYEVIGEAEVQISTRQTCPDGIGNGVLPNSSIIREGRAGYESDKLTIYRCTKTGKLWCRFADEFRDGRFETITPAPAPHPAPAGQTAGEV